MFRWCSLVVLVACGPDPRGSSFGDMRWRLDGALAANEWNTEIAVDGAGDVIVAGNSYDRTSAAISKHSRRDGSLIWRTILASLPPATPGTVETTPGTVDTTPATVEMLHVAPASDGAIFVTGYHAGAVDFGGQVLRDGGAFVAKYDVAGVLAWAREVGAPGSCGLRIAVAPDGDVYAAGGCSGPLVVGSTSLDCNGMFVAEFSQDGTPRWAITDGEGGLPGYAVDITIAADSTIVFTADASGRPTAVAMSSDGTPAWRREVSTDWSARVALAPALDGGSLVATPGELTHIAAHGEPVWRIAGPADGSAVVVLPSGSAVVGSSYLQAFSRDGEPLDAHEVPGDRSSTFGRWLAATPDGGLVMLADGALISLAPPT